METADKNIDENGFGLSYYENLSNEWERRDGPADKVSQGNINTFLKIMELNDMSCDSFSSQKSRNDTLLGGTNEILPNVLLHAPSQKVEENSLANDAQAGHHDSLLEMIENVYVDRTTKSHSNHSSSALYSILDQYCVSDEDEIIANKYSAPRNPLCDLANDHRSNVEESNTLLKLSSRNLEAKCGKTHESAALFDIPSTLREISPSLKYPRFRSEVYNPFIPKIHKQSGKLISTGAAALIPKQVSKNTIQDSPHKQMIIEANEELQRARRLFREPSDSQNTGKDDLIYGKILSGQTNELGSFLGKENVKSLARKGKRSSHDSSIIALGMFPINPRSKAAATAIDASKIPLHSFNTPIHQKAIPFTRNVNHITPPTLISTSSQMKTIPLKKIWQDLKAAGHEIDESELTRRPRKRYAHVLSMARSSHR